MRPRDRLWMERAKRRYGRLIDLAARWSTRPAMPGQQLAGEALLVVGAQLLRWDRKLFNALAR